MTIQDVHGLTSQMIAEGHPQAEILVEDDGGLSRDIAVAWFPRWGEHGQLEITKWPALIIGHGLARWPLIEKE